MESHKREILRLLVKDEKYEDRFGREAAAEVLDDPFLKGVVRILESGRGPETKAPVRPAGSVAKSSLSGTYHQGYITS